MEATIDKYDETIKKDDNMPQTTKKGGREGGREGGMSVNTHDMHRRFSYVERGGRPDGGSSKGRKREKI